jgi:hypothetical protein
MSILSRHSRARALHPPLGEGVRPRDPRRCFHNLHALGPQDLIELSGELGIAVADQDPGRDRQVVEMPR